MMAIILIFLFQVPQDPPSFPHLYGKKLSPHEKAHPPPPGVPPFSPSPRPSLPSHLKPNSEMKKKDPFLFFPQQQPAFFFPPPFLFLARLPLPPPPLLNLVPCDAGRRFFTSLFLVSPDRAPLFLSNNSGFFLSGSPFCPPFPVESSL